MHSKHSSPRLRNITEEMVQEMADGEETSGNGMAAIHIKAQHLWASAQGQASGNPSTDVGGVPVPIPGRKASGNWSRQSLGF